MGSPWNKSSQDRETITFSPSISCNGCMARCVGLLPSTDQLVFTPSMSLYRMVTSPRLWQAIREHRCPYSKVVLVFSSAGQSINPIGCPGSLRTAAYFVGSTHKLPCPKSSQSIFLGHCRNDITHDYDRARCQRLLPIDIHRIPGREMVGFIW